MFHLFVYGTLMCEDIMREVSGCRPHYILGRLKGFSRRAVKLEQYPAILPDEQGSVSGGIYLNVPDPAMERLDRFEGGMYVRRSVQVEFDLGMLLPAETYVIRSEFTHVLEVFDWDYENFLRCGKVIFREHFRGYRSLNSANQAGAPKPDARMDGD